MVTTLIITRAVHIAASILIAGIFTFDLIMLGLTGPSESDDLHEIRRRLFRLAVWSMIAALLSAVLWFWLEVASMSGLPLKNTFSASAWGTVLLETQFGRVWQLRLGLIAIAFVLVASALAQVKARRALIAILWLVSVVLLVSLALISHAAAATMQPFGVLGDMIHLCAAGLWIGGLVPLAIFLAVRPCVILVKRNGALCTAPFFYAQPVLRECSRRKWNFQQLAAHRFNLRAFHDALWPASAF